MAKKSTEETTRKKPASKSGKVELTEQELKDEDLDKAHGGARDTPLKQEPPIFVVEPPVMFSGFVQLRPSSLERTMRNWALLPIS